MGDLRRDSQRISLFREKTIGGGSSSSIVSDIWNITQGQAFSLHTEALTSSATVTIAIYMWPGINGGGTPIIDVLASNIAVGVLNESAIEINATVCKSMKAMATNTGSSAAVITQSLLMF